MMTDDKPKERSIAIGRDAVGGHIVTGDANVVVFHHHGNVSVEPVDEVDESIRKAAIPQDLAFERIDAAVRLNLDQLERNIEQARKESNQFFKLTLVFASIGFLVVMVAIVFLLLGQVTAGIVSAVSSVIPEVTGALFFTKDRELRKTIESYHQHILDSQGILTMVDVATTIEKKEERDRVKQKIIYKVLDIPTTDPGNAA